jgi:two-component system, LuxR family, sensor kinase FixL
MQAMTVSDDAANGAQPDGRAARLLAAIVASSDDAIISKTLDGVITSWNGGAERIFGYAADEAIGRPISFLALPGREDEMSAILQRLRLGERIDHFETSRRRKDGSTVILSLSVSPILDEHGAIIGASKVARDVTAIRQAADALRKAQAQLQEQHVALMHAARLGELGQMAATLAHELNQPLTAIVNYLHSCRRLLAADGGAHDPRIDVALQKAAAQALRGGEVMSRLRAFAKPTDGHQTAESIGDILQDAASLATIDAGQSGVGLTLGVLPQTCMVIADRIEIQQVLLNLIRNALEAMEGQHRRQIHLAAIPRPELVEVEVSDTGPGVPPEVRERFCEPFVTTKPNGMGIGLSICRKIIDNHGGRFWVEDNPGGGASFRFTLRAA